MSEKHVQLEIWDLLEEAKEEPFEVDWDVLWDGLDMSLVGLGVSEQLQVASIALLQMVEVFRIRSMETFEELEAYTSNDGPVMGDGDFATFVRQFVDIDFDDFIEPLISPVPRTYTSGEGRDNQTIVEVVDREVLLENIEESQERRTQEEVTSAIEIAYSENVSEWIEAITNYFIVASTKTATWSELQNNLNIASVEILLGLLLGNFDLSQVQNEFNSFYDCEILIETYS